MPKQAHRDVLAAISVINSKTSLRYYLKIHKLHIPTILTADIKQRIRDLPQ
jgi:hypothetical protein